MQSIYLLFFFSVVAAGGLSPETPLQIQVGESYSQKLWDVGNFQR